MNETEFRYLSAVISTVYIANRRTATGSIQILKMNSKMSYVRYLRNICPELQINWKVMQQINNKFWGKIKLFQYL